MPWVDGEALSSDEDGEDYEVECLAMLKSIVGQMARQQDRLSDTERGLILVRGSVPGVKGGWVSVRDAVKRKLPDGAPKPGSFKAPVEVAAAANE